MKERHRETISSFLWGTTLPGVLVVPTLGYAVVSGDRTLLIGVAEVGLPLMGLWGIAGISEFKGSYQAGQERKKVRVTSRRTVKETLLRRPPSTPKEVAEFLTRVYEHWETDALAAYDPTSTAEPEDEEKVFVEGFSDPATVSAHLASRLINRTISLLRRESKSGMKATETGSADELIQLLKFGWKVNKWHKKGDFLPVPNDGTPYSEGAVAGTVTRWFCDTFQKKTAKDLHRTLEVIALSQ